MWRMRRKWRFGGLLLSWLAYWAIIFAIKLGPAVAAIWRVSHAPDRDKGDVSFTVSNAVISVIVKLDGKVQWAGTTTFAVLTAWIAIGPLLLWLLWMVLGARASAESEPHASEREVVR